MAQEGDLICTFLSFYLHPADTYFPFMHNDAISLFGLYYDTVPPTNQRQHAHCHMYYYSQHTLDGFLRYFSQYRSGNTGST